MNKPEFIEIVPQYPLPIAIYEKEDYQTWPVLLMKKRGYKVKIITLKNDRQKETEIIKGIEIIRFKNILKLFFYILKNKALYYAQGKLFPLFIGFFTKNSIYITHSTMGQNLPKYFSNPVFRFIYKLSLSKFSKVIAISPYEMSLLNKYNFKKNYTYIPNAIDCKFFSKHYMGSKFLEKYNLPIKSKKIIFLGNMHQGGKTNIETLFKAFRIVLDKFPDTKLIVIGKFPGEIKELKEFIPVVNSVILTGWLPHTEFIKAFSIADVYVNTSRFEGDPLSVSEAACARIPLCLSNIPTLRSIYKDSALYHNPDDYTKLSKNIISNFKNSSNKINNKTKSYNIIYQTKNVNRINSLFQNIINDLEKEKNPLITEWKKHWLKSNINYSINQIKYEDFFRESLSSLFTSGEKVLEAGCGFGRYCFWLEKKGVKTVGIDIVEEAIKEGNKYAKKNRCKTKLLVGNVCDLPFKNNSFNGYISLGVIEHFRTVEEIKKAFQEAYRILKPGGKAFIVIPNPIAPHMILEKILSLLGFTNIYHRSLYKTDLIKYGKDARFKITKIKIHDFYFPPYSIITSVLRHDIWWLKIIMKKTLNIFDKFPVLNNFGSGIAIIFKKNEN